MRSAQATSRPVAGSINLRLSQENIARAAAFAISTSQTTGGRPRVLNQKFSHKQTGGAYNDGTTKRS